MSSNGSNPNNGAQLFGQLVASFSGVLLTVLVDFGVDLTDAQQRDLLSLVVVTWGLVSGAYAWASRGRHPITTTSVPASVQATAPPPPAPAVPVGYQTSETQVIPAAPLLPDPPTWPPYGVPPGPVPGVVPGPGGHYPQAQQPYSGQRPENPRHDDWR